MHDLSLEFLERELRSYFEPFKWSVSTSSYQVIRVWQPVFSDNYVDTKDVTFFGESLSLFNVRFHSESSSKGRHWYRSHLCTAANNYNCMAANKNGVKRDI